MILLYPIKQYFVITTTIKKIYKINFNFFNLNFSQKKTNSTQTKPLFYSRHHFQKKKEEKYK